MLGVIGHGSQAKVKQAMLVQDFNEDVYDQYVPQYFVLSITSIHYLCV
jgi:hypothetical protein